MLAVEQGLVWNINHIGYWLIPLGPLCGLVVCAGLAFSSNFSVRRLAHWPCVLGVFVAFLGSIMVVLNVVREPQHIAIFPIYTWIATDGFRIGMNLYYDSLSCVMVCLVSSVSLLVAVYSIGYMKDDEGYGRYFTVMSLFVFSMVMLVLSDNYLTMYMFWEGVGLCSYLLIGHWYERPAASAAALKAFLVNRVGDLAFMLAILLIWINCGTLQLVGVWVAAAGLSWPTTVLICLLLLGGASAKSAQFPLHVWLPDAMEGPTPVSALIHAATMVTAGVYLLARSSFLLAGTPEAQVVVMVIGITTALLAALTAITQYDLKRVLAYSTISQLGLMFTSLGVAGYSEQISPAAASAAIFHLCMHGFFKALLFLSAGNIMHATHGIIDMRLLGGLRQSLPYTHACFAIGGLGLAAIPPLAGFWSKEAILEAMVFAAQKTQHWGIWSVISCYYLTGLLTAFYITRAYVLTFWGEIKLDTETAQHVHEPSKIMAAPVLLLALATLVLGIVLGPTGLFQKFLHLSEPFGPVIGNHHSSIAWMLVSIAVALSGAVFAAYTYGSAPGLRTKLVRWLGVVYILSAGRFFIDEFYRFAIVKPSQLLAAIAEWLDKLIDGLIDLTGWLVWSMGRLLRPMQNGQVQFYALAMLLGLVVFCLVLVSKWGG
jgi:NADH-quinone oxidoreductase subunit L